MAAANLDVVVEQLSRVTFDGDTRITSVGAELAGSLQPGDKISHVNHLPVDAAALHARLQASLTGHAIPRCTLTVQRAPRAHELTRRTASAPRQEQPRSLWSRLTGRTRALCSPTSPRSPRSPGTPRHHVIDICGSPRDSWTNYPVQRASSLSAPPTSPASPLGARRAS